MDHIGARPEGGATAFRVWAPRAQRVEVVVDGVGHPLRPAEHGYHAGRVEGVGAGARYRYRLDGGDALADPASRWQPEGVHGPSAVVDPDAFAWSDPAWRGVPLDRLVVYELHVGTFTPEGTFDGVVPRLPALRDLGVTAIEVMPVAEFPGARNWGYDGVFPWAAQSTYGGPDGLRRLVDAAHREGIAVILDVVYNHLGPEGNILGRYGPYFTDAYRTPWGDAINVDQAHSDEVRDYLVGNALHWFREHHVDALRLDAVHAIRDFSAVPFLAQLSDATAAQADATGRPALLIAESDLNDARVVAPRRENGLGLHAQWSDDFHHALHALVTGERDGYLGDFGGLDDLATAIRQGWVYAGRRSGFRERRHGNSPARVGNRQLVVYAQNHDQIGNRPRGDRLAERLGHEERKLVAGLVLLAPFVPMLFMGEEHGDEAPFPYFVSHTDPELVEAVRRGRAEEFAGFEGLGEPLDPQAEETFAAARLHWDRREEGRHGALLRFHRDLLRLRREEPALARLDRDAVEVLVHHGSGVLDVRRWVPDGGAVRVRAVLGDDPVPAPAGGPVLIDSSDPRYGGPGRAPEVLVPKSLVVVREPA